jgi:hypothetical protein
LEGNEDFQAVMSWLEDNLKKIREGSAYTKDEVSLRWEQGAMQVLSEFCDKAKSARQLQYAKKK